MLGVLTHPFYLLSKPVIPSSEVAPLKESRPRRNWTVRTSSSIQPKRKRFRLDAYFLKGRAKVLLFCDIRKKKVKKLMHFAGFVGDGEAGDVVAVVTKVEAFAGTEDDHADVELSAAALAGIRFFEFILLLVGTFFEALHDSGFVGFALGERFVGIRTLDRLVGFGLGSDILLDVLNGLHVLGRSDDEGLRHTRDKVFVSGPLGKMGFFVMFEDGIGI